MLISTDKKFIFVHVPKTAGTSVTNMLSPYCLTPERTSYRRFLSHVPVPEDPHKAFMRKHDKAWWLKIKLPREMFDNYLKFAVVRNPFDYAVSYYFYTRRNVTHSRHKMAMRSTFSQYLKAMERKNWLTPVTQNSWLTDISGRHVIVDRILRFETLHDDLEALCGELGIEMDMPHANSSSHRHYSGYYSAEDRALAEKLFARDLEMFGYRFEQA
ncbi:MAG: sulfotransferase family 2 domain-containing protein [Notoacmeibacter sp.]|nr:sulfotransferase family 2 domain-containing protein [Notoacmeibacter sp.]